MLYLDITDMPKERQRCMSHAAYGDLWERCQPEELIKLWMKALLSSRSHEKLMFLLLAPICNNVITLKECWNYRYLVLTACNVNVPYQMQADVILTAYRDASCWW